MQINLKFSGLGLVAVVAMGLLAWFAHDALRPEVITSSETNVVAQERPLVMPTSGGRLEIATVKAYERFTRKDSKQFWGIDLGTTVSQIQATVVYRYHIEMARQWPLSIVGTTCVVRAGAVQPTLPVAFDTTTVQKYSRSGWARFDRQESLALLEQSMTPALQARAQSDQYRQLARDAGRQVVAGFVTTWLLKEQQWKRSPEYKVVVLFPGETLAKDNVSPVPITPQD